MSDSPNPASLKPANEEVSADALEVALAEALTGGRFALSWYHENELDHLARPLQKALDQVRGYAVKVSADIGDAGFALDENSRTLFLSSSALNAVVASSVSFGNIKGSDPLAHPLVSAAISIYLFHELTHISQTFIKHEQAKDLKDAFGNDIFAMIDCITDIKAAHCETLISVAFSGSFSKADYISTFKFNVLLAYQLLVDAFSIKGAEHKKKRALGLLSTSAICDVALLCDDGRRSGLMSMAMTPVFTSLVRSKERMVCLCPENGDIVFVSDKSSNGITAVELWDSLENVPVPEALSFLRLAFSSYAYATA